MKKRSLKAEVFFVFTLGFIMFALGLIMFTQSGFTQDLDGNHLPSRPPKLSQQDQKALYDSGRQLCQTHCINDFAQLIGENSGVKAYSNCQASCIYDQYSWMKLDQSQKIRLSKQPLEGYHYIGLVYQCVEYARRWWMKNKQITFGDVDAAYDILYLTRYKQIYKQKEMALGRSINGQAKRSPQVGDLVIYGPKQDDPNWRFGHVAVITAVDFKLGFVNIAEQNHARQTWEHGTYSRKLLLTKKDDYYTLSDHYTKLADKSLSGSIWGWVYPLQTVE